MGSIQKLSALVVAACLVGTAFAADLTITEPTTITESANYERGDIGANLTINPSVALGFSGNVLLRSGVDISLGQKGRFLTNPLGTRCYNVVTNLGAGFSVASMGVASDLYDLTGMNKIPLCIEKMVLPPEATTAADTFDIMTLNGYSFADITCFVNENTTKPARYLFNGGMLRHGYWVSAGKPLQVSEGAKVVFEGINSRNIVIVPSYTVGGTFFSGAGTFETAGDCNVIISGFGANDPIPETPCTKKDEDVFGRAKNGGVNRSWFRVTSNGTWNWKHKKDLRLQGTAWLRLSRTDGLPHGSETGIVRLDNWSRKLAITGTSGDSPRLDLNGYSSAINGLIADETTEVTNFATAVTSTLTFGTEDMNGDLRAKIRGNINVEKIGTGTLSVTNSALPQALAVKGGTVAVLGATALDTVSIAAGAELSIGGPGVICRDIDNAGTLTTTKDISLRQLTLAAGSTVIIDGATVSYETLDDQGATVTLLNGGRLVRAIDSAGETLIRAVDAPFAGDRTIRVQNGTLTFTGDRCTNEWWRFRFRERKSSLEIGRVGLFADENWCTATGLDSYPDGKAASLCYGINPCDAAELVSQEATRSNYVYSAATATAPKDLPHGKALLTPGKIFRKWYSGRNAGDLNYLFKSGGAAEIMDIDSSSVDPTDESTWVDVTFRLASNTASKTYNLVRRYSLYVTSYAGGEMATSWVVESSPDGVNWDRMDDRVVDKPWQKYFSDVGVNYNWYERPGGFPLTAGHLLGSAGFDPTIEFQVDPGATLDCSYMDAPQTLANLTVDAATGAGTIRNVALAADGVLRILNAPKGRLSIPVTFVGSSGFENLPNWQVYINGKLVDRTAAWSGSSIDIEPSGLLLIVR